MHECETAATTLFSTFTRSYKDQHDHALNHMGNPLLPETQAASAHSVCALRLLVTANLKVLAALYGVHVYRFARLALQPQHNLLCRFSLQQKGTLTSV